MRSSFRILSLNICSLSRFLKFCSQNQCLCIIIFYYNIKIYCNILYCTNIYISDLRTFYMQDINNSDHVHVYLYYHLFPSSKHSIDFFVHLEKSFNMFWYKEWIYNSIMLLFLLFPIFDYYLLKSFYNKQGNKATKDVSECEEYKKN